MPKEKSRESVYYLSEEEMQKIADSATNFRDRVLIEVLANTGVRRAELRDICIEDVDYERKRIYVKEGKGKKPRTVPVNSKTLTDIKQLIGNRTKGNVFTSPKNYPNGLSLKQINEIVAKCAQRAGVNNPNPGKKQINPHLFRHSCARNLLKKGMPIQYVQRILGHKSIQTTVDIYGTPSDKDVQEEYERVMENK